MVLLRNAKYYLAVVFTCLLFSLCGQNKTSLSRLGAGTYGSDDCTCCDEDPTHPDYVALVEIYNSTGGPNWTNTTSNNMKWLECHPCQWYGITCSGNRVTRIDLSDNNLNGSIIDDLQELTQLEELNLSNNNITNFLAALSNWGTIRVINLSNNDIGFNLSEAFANVGQYSLEVLDFSNNSLYAIPDNIWNIRSLRNLDFSHNEISGNLPINSSNFSNLEILDLSYNRFTIPFPTIIGNLQNLDYLDLSHNGFQGCIPSQYNTLCGIQNNVFLDNNCNLSMPSFANWCQGSECVEELLLTGPSSSCQGESIVVTAPEGYDDYSWDFPCALGNRLASSHEQAGVCPGTYSVTATNALGCSITGSFVVDEYFLADENVSTSFCEGEAAFVGGEIFTEPGVYPIFQIAEIGCPFILWATITEIPRPRRTVNLDICDGSHIVLHGRTYDTEGTYMQNVFNPGGCDSLLTVNVTILDTYSSSVNLYACPGNLASHDGVSYPIGNHNRTYTAASGCDSLVYIGVSALPTFTSSVVLEACTGMEAIHDGISYPIGNHLRPYTAMNGCDSIVTIIVEELFPSFISEEYTICNGQTVNVNGQYYVGGQYQQNFINDDGCESILYIEVDETPPYEIFDSLLMCDGQQVVYQFQHYFNNGGDFTINKTDGEGCNYIVNLHIAEEVSTIEDVTVIACDGVYPVYYKGKPYYNTISVTQHTNVAGCDSTLIVRTKVEQSSEETLVIPPMCYPDFATVNDITYGYTNIFEQHLTNAAGCDSTLYIQVTVNHDETENLYREICPGQSLTVNGVTYNGPGIYNQYLNTVAGCDSTLRIRIEETDLITSENFVLLCGDETYFENSTTYSETGIYELYFTTPEGCDSLYTLHIDKYENTAFTIYDRLCTGDEIMYNDQVFEAAGTYEQHLLNSNGCDSTITIIISEFAPTSEFVQRETCEGTPWTENGISYAESGLYEQVVANSVDCDSTITIDLTVHPNTTEDLSLQVCQDQIRYVNDIPYDEAGTFYQSITNSKGCDSLLTIVVEIVDEVRADLNVEICQGETIDVNGEEFNQSTVAEQYFTSSIGCDSILTVYVTMHLNTEGAIEEQVCVGSSVFINDREYTTGGVKIQNLENSKGCDSTLLITIEEIHPSSSENYFEMCEGDPLLINGIQYDYGGFFEQLYVNAVGCDSTFFIEILEHPDTEETIYRYFCPGEVVSENGVDYTQPNVYQQSFTNEQGCDSTLFIDVRYFPPSDTTIYDYICDEGTYDFMGETLTSAGLYTFHTQTSRGCDSMIYLELGQLTGRDTTIFRTICDGNFYQFGSHKLYKADTYFDEIIIGGCKTPTTVVLEVLEPTEGFRTKHICEGELFWVNGQLESEAGLYEEVIPSSQGCDSILTTELIIEKHKETSVDTFICEGGSVYFSNFHYTRPGNYRINRKTQYGCDSIVKLNIDLYDTIPDIFEFEVCEGGQIEFEQSSYGVGIYQGSYFDGNCDQNYQLIVTETQTLEVNATEFACDGPVEFMGESYHHTGQYYIGKETGTCEYLNYLYVVGEVEAGDENFLFMCEGTSLEMGDRVISESGVYEMQFCDIEVEMEVVFVIGDTIYMERTINPDQSIKIEGDFYFEAGTYEIEVGKEAKCSSMLILTIKVEACGGMRAMDLQLCKGEEYDFYSQTIQETGTYTHHKPLSFGCDSVIQLNVNFSQIEDFEIEGNDILCKDGAINLEGPEGMNYLWSTGETSRNISVDEDGTYSLTITNENGCEKEAFIEVNEVVFPSVLDISREQPESCEFGDGAITVHVEQVERYIYSIDNGEIWQESNEFTSLKAGQYYVLLADPSLSCFRSFALPVTLENKSIPTISNVEVHNKNSCIGVLGNISVEAYGNGDLVYSIDNGETWQVEPLFEDLQAGSYVVWVGPKGSTCINDFHDSIVIRDEGNLEALLDVKQNLSCEDSQDGIIEIEILNGLPPFTFSWSNGLSGKEIANLAAGTYEVTIEDNNNCQIMLSATLDQPILSQVLLPFEDTSLCEDASLLYSELDTNYHYVLFKEDQFLSEGLEFVIDDPGHYQIIADRGNGCYTDKDFLVEPFSAEDLGIDFLLSSNANVGESVVVVNVSDPMPTEYSWEFDSSAINIGEFDSLSVELTFNAPGIYDISFLADIDNCTARVTKQIAVDTLFKEGSEGAQTTSGNRLIDFQVSPNPNDGNFEVFVSLSEEEPIRIGIYNIYGSRIGVVMRSDQDTYLEQFEMPFLGNGVYTVLLRVENQVFQKNILVIK